MIYFYLFYNKLTNRNIANIPASTITKSFFVKIETTTVIIPAIKKRLSSEMSILPSITSSVGRSKAPKIATGT